MIAIIILSIACAGLCLCVALCLRRIAALVRLVEDLNSRVETSLDVLEEAHRSIVRSAGRELISDDIFVRRVVAAIMASKRAVHEVAVTLASFDADAVENIDDGLHERISSK